MSETHRGGADLGGEHARSVELGLIEDAVAERFAVGAESDVTVDDGFKDAPRPTKPADSFQSVGLEPTIPMPSDVAGRLRRHLTEQTVADLGGFVFTAPRGGPVRYDNWRSRTWRRIAESAGVGEVHPHDLRHTAATRLFVVDRWTPAEVQRFLGHADPRITLGIYTHVVAEELPAPSSLAEISKDVVT